MVNNEYVELSRSTKCIHTQTYGLRPCIVNETQRKCKRKKYEENRMDRERYLRNFWSFCAEYDNNNHHRIKHLENTYEQTICEWNEINIYIFWGCVFMFIQRQHDGTEREDKNEMEKMYACYTRPHISISKIGCVVFRRDIAPSTNQIKISIDIYIIILCM